MTLNRRGMLTGLMASAATVPLWAAPSAEALGLPVGDTIKRIRYYITGADAAGRGDTSGIVHQPTFNQSTNIVTVETASGLMGVGEGGAPDTIQQVAEMLIGADPFRTEQLWQQMFRGYFYPAGHEKQHALGAIDLALWDIKGKALGVPVWQLLGGKARDHVECYATGYPTPQGGTLEDAARACVAEGFRAYRHALGGGGAEMDRFKRVDQIAADCALLFKGAGSGGWAIDFHQELDPEDAITLCDLIQPLKPYFVEDLVRTENTEVYRTIRPRTHVPIAVGEEYGAKWDIASLIENQLIDYARVTSPNVGGVTEYMKICALAETHLCGMIPHFTGPIGETSLVHCLTATSVPALMEMTGAGRRAWTHLPQAYDFHDGKLWPNDRPGLGVTLDTRPLKMVGEWTAKYMPIQMNHRPDGSFTNW